MATYWNNTGKYEEEATALQDLVPGSGPADTLKGEIMRATSKIYYDFFNNGFGNTWVEPAAFLMDHVDLPEEVKNVLYEHAAGNICGSDSHVEEMMDLMIDTVVEQLRDVEDKPNDLDMWAYPVSYQHDFEPYYEEEEDEDDYDYWDDDEEDEE